jgi:hypothetical protein
MWCEDERTLHSIYRFPHLQASILQATSHIEKVNNLFMKFLSSSFKYETLLQFQKQCPIWWLGEYGCAVLFVSDVCSSTTTHVNLLALDEWRHEMHQSTAVSYPEHIACAGKHQMLSVGKIDSDVDTFLTLCRNALQHKNLGQSNTKIHKTPGRRSIVFIGIH